MCFVGPKADVLRQQQQRIHFDSAQNRDAGDAQRGHLSSVPPPSKSSFRLQRRFEIPEEHFSSFCEICKSVLHWAFCSLQATFQCLFSLRSLCWNIPGSRTLTDRIYPPSGESAAAAGGNQTRWVQDSLAWHSWNWCQRSFSENGTGSVSLPSRSQN